MSNNKLRKVSFSGYLRFDTDGFQVPTIETFLLPQGANWGVVNLNVYSSSFTFPFNDVHFFQGCLSFAYLKRMHGFLKMHHFCKCTRRLLDRLFGTVLVITVVPFGCVLLSLVGREGEPPSLPALEHITFLGGESLGAHEARVQAQVQGAVPDRAARGRVGVQPVPLLQKKG